MVSMKSATDNANTMIKDLTLALQQAASGRHHPGAAGDRRRPGRIELEGIRMNTGTIVQVDGPVVDVAFPGRAPRDHERPDRRVHRPGSARDADARSAAAPRRPLGAHHLDVGNRGAQTRPRGHRQRRADHMPVGPGVMGRVLNVTGAPVDERGPVVGGEVLPDPPTAAVAGRSVDVARGALDRHQGDRPDLPVPEGRQDRRVRRRRRGQDRRHHGVDQQHRQAARRRVGVCRRRRAHARRQRPLSRDGDRPASSTRRISAPRRSRSSTDR